MERGRFLRRKWPCLAWRLRISVISCHGDRGVILTLTQGLRNVAVFAQFLRQRIMSVHRRAYPANTRHRNNDVLMLAQRLRRCPALKQHCFNVSRLLGTDANLAGRPQTNLVSLGVTDGSIYK